MTVLNNIINIFSTYINRLIGKPDHMLLMLYNIMMSEEEI